MGDLVLTLTTRAMGTRFELVLVGPGVQGHRSASRALRAAGEAAFEQIHDTEARWSRFLTTSRLSQLARDGHRRPVVLDQDDLDLWRTILAVIEATGGAFDVDHAPGTRLRLAGRELSLAAPGAALDLGAVAKGHALDLAGRELREAGVACALLHGGTSSVLAIGAPPERAAWRVRVAELHGAAEDAGRDLDLVDQALAASRSDAQGDQQDPGHVVDPRSGAPLGSADLPHRSALVTAPSAALADAWSTALCVDPDLVPAAEAMGVRVHGHGLAAGPIAEARKPAPDATPAEPLR